MKFKKRFVLLFSFNQKLLLMTELTAGGAGVRSPTTVCIVCKLRPVFCVLLRVADAL